MKTTFILLAAASLICVGGCSSGQYADEAPTANSSVAHAGENVTDGAPQASVGEQKGVSASDSKAAGQTDEPHSQLATDQSSSRRAVIRRADLTVRVKEVEAAEQQIGDVVKAWGGYVASASSTDLSSEEASITLELKIPESRFDEAIRKFESLGVRLSKKIDARDVTAQLVDISARLKTMQAEEDSIRQILASSRNLSQTLEIKDRLAELRGKIESLAAQRKELSGLATLSTIDVTLVQSAAGPVVGAAKDPNWFRESWAGASSSAMTSFRVIASVVVWFLVYAPLWLPVVLVLRWAIRKYSRQSSPSTETRFQI